MFSDRSRYSRQKTCQAKARDGRTVSAITLRVLPATAGNDTAVAGNDRLDVMAQRQYNDPTRFWHIADANTELEAHDLLKPPGMETPNPPQAMLKLPAN